MDEKDFREIYENMSEVKERLVKVETNVSYIKAAVDEIKKTPCKKGDYIQTNRKMIGILYLMMAGIVTYLTGIKLIG